MRSCAAHPRLAPASSSRTVAARAAAAPACAAAPPPPTTPRRRHPQQPPQQPQQQRLGRVALSLAAAAAISLSPPPAVADSAGVVLGAELFSSNCAGCHTGGGNVVEPAQTLRSDALERNGLTDAGAVRAIIYGGKRKMPGYGEECTPRGACTFGPRLSDDQIAALADFVLAQAAAGWTQ